MSEQAMAEARSVVQRILAAPTPASLWELQKALLDIDGEQAHRARAVAQAFHACLRTLESKSSSRAASRWGAVLGTAAVGGVTLPELLRRQEHTVQELLASAMPALLEVGSALQIAQAWEVEARLSYDDVAWTLYEELWDVSAAARPELRPPERRARIDALVDPLLDAELPDGARAGLAVELFRAVLAARLAPLL